MNTHWALATEHFESHSVGEIITLIDDELKAVQAIKTNCPAGCPRLILEDIDLTLTVVEAQEGEAGLSLSVPVLPIGIDANAALRQETTRQITVGFKLGEFEVGKQQSLGLADAVARIKAAFQTALSQSKYLKPNRADYSLDFELHTEGGGKISFLVFEAGASLAETNRSSIHFWFRVD